MIRFLLASVCVLSLAAVAAAACGPARAHATPVRSALGALREHRLERIQHRGAGCAGVTVGSGCRGTTSYGCTGFTPAPAPMPLSPVVPLKK